jgi:CDP-diacylglycerol--serine O-phosphatidyltransferase
MGKKLFIVRLNWVDCITLSGVITTSIATGLALNGFFTLALAMLFMTMVTDALDGVLARKFKLERPFGRYLDGFIDVLEYLVVPSLLLYSWGFNTPFYAAVLMFFIMAGVVRLSVFNEIGNVKGADDGLSYLGMPVFWATFITAGAYLLGLLLPLWLLFPALAIILIAYAVAMVYNDRFYKFKSLKVILFLTGGQALFFFCLHLIGVY